MFKKTTDALQSFIRSPYSLPFAILMIGVAAYGLHIYWMGFYWDDWPWVWLSHVKGPQGVLKIDEFHRPLTGVVLYIGALLSGDNPVLWQSYNLAGRLMGAGALAWALHKLWPEHRQRTIWVTLLFLVYPGFTQQFVAINSSRHIFPLITFFLSLGFTIQAAQQEARYWRYTSLALLFSLITMFTTEYYYGIEFIRPVILWMIIRREEKNFIPGVMAAFKAWIPYLVPVLGVFAWRYSVSKSVNYEITIFNEVTNTPESGIFLVVKEALLDLFTATFGAWSKAFALPDPTLFGGRTRLYYWVIVSGITLGTLIYLIFAPTETEEKAWWQEALILGAAALVISPLPFWVTGLDPKLAFPADRLLLPSILGVSLLLAGIIDLIFKRSAVKVILLSLLIGFAVGSHNQNGISYRRDWGYTVAFFQQLTTRIPDLPSNTAILSNELPNSRSTDNSLTAPLNWVYAPDFADGDLPLQLLYIDLRFGRQNPVVEGNPSFANRYIYYPFRGSPDQVLVIYHAPPACLRVVDSTTRQPMPAFVEDVLEYSKPELILTEAEPVLSLPAALGRDPQTENWCYYFEKADLARQQGEWERVVELGEIAFALSDSPNDAAERVPFIEGYAHTGQWARAEALTYETLEINQFAAPLLCETWERIEANTTPSTERDTILETINTQLDCSLY